MISPFPGMDPYLEGLTWPDVHNLISSKIRKQLNAKIAPRYVAVVERYVVKDTNPTAEYGGMYPDISVMLRSNQVKEPAVAYGGQRPLKPATLVVPMMQAIDVKIPVVKIKDKETNELVTAIEILSPVNKRRPGLLPYLKKKKELHDQNVHFLELDLLRRGQRTVEHPQLADTDYLVALTRATAYQTEIWEIDLMDMLPVVPVPLSESATDVALDLQQAMDEAYEEAGYGLVVDYTKAPPPPALSKAKMEWMQDILKKKTAE